jgi:murein DD-endopeptidase MepM/ murein hydrolase activator NlpD
VNRPRSRRYTIVIADRRTGVYRQLSVNARPILLTLVALLTVPVLVGLGLRWSARSEIVALRAGVELLDTENRSYRAATGALTSQIQSLQNALTEIGRSASVDPATLKAMERLPAIVKSRAVGGAPAPPRVPYAAAFSTPEDTFGLLRELLYGIESRLRLVKDDVERRQALAAATPSIWPVHGWLTAGFGRRNDPFTGQPEQHSGLDINADRGQPVQSTASGTVQSAGWAGAYGNMVVIEHGFGIATRYAHLQTFRVKPGELVSRGAIVGTAGATGRATGDHLHYEVLVHGRPLNPLRFLSDQQRLP